MTEVWKLYRPDDPATSREAAEELPVSNLEGIVAGVIFNAGKHGCISDDVRAVCEFEHGITSYSSVTARFKALAEKGIVTFTGEKRPGRSGRSQRVMIHKRFAEATNA